MERVSSLSAQPKYLMTQIELSPKVQFDSSLTVSVHDPTLRKLCS
jgi:hypothetical protein